MDTHTIIVTAEQRAMMVNAMTVYARMFVGQTVREQEAAARLLKEFVAVRGTTANLTQVPAL